MEVKPGYKQTEVGVIPEEWETVRLGSLSSFITSGSRGWARYYSGNGALFVRSQNVRDGRLDFLDKQYVNPPDGTEGNRTRLMCGDLLITITGNSVGNVALLEEDLGESYISQHVGLVRLPETSSGQFVCRFLSPGSPGNPQIILSQSGQSKPGLTLKNLQDFWVAFPPFPEQRAIAGALGDVDGLIEALDRLIAKKRDLKQAAMQQLLTGHTRLPGEWEVKAGFKQTEMGVIPEDWEVRRFSEHFKIYAGGDVPKHSLSQTQSSSHPYPIFANALQDKGLYGYTNERRSREDSLTITARGYLGHAEHRDEPFFPIVRLLVLEPIGQLDAKFTTYAVNDRVEFAIESTGVPQLTAPQIGKYSVAVPSTLHEQTAIAAVLSDMDAELAALEARRDKTRALKQGMMQELLTGRTRLV